MSLRERTVHGIAWTAVSRLIGQVVGYTVSVVLARILSPADFGLVGMVLVFTGFASVFIDFGIGAAIVQRKEIEPDQLSASFWATTGMGVFLTLLFFFGAPLIGKFYGRPELVPLTRACSLSFLLASIGIVPRALFSREMQIKRLMLFDLGVSMSAGALSVVLAMRGAGVWTIVASSLWTTAGQSFLPLLAGKWKPGLRAGLAPIRPLLSISLNLLGFSVLNYWARNFDNLIIGAMLGAVQLGIYTRGYGLMLLPIGQIGSIVSSGLVPAMARMHEDKPRTGRVFLRLMRFMAFTAFPVMVGLCVAADPFVRAVYGPNWLGLIPVLRVLAIVGALQALMNPTGWIYISQGRTDRLFRWGLGSIPLILISLYVGGRFGSSLSVATSYLVINVILTGPCLSLAAGLIDVRLSQIIRAVLSPLAHTLAMAAAVILVGHVLPPDLKPVTTLVLQVLTGAVVYALTNVGLSSAAYVDLKQELAGRLRGKRSAPAAPQATDG
jgi:PST family polysaccharide transporter